MNVAVISGNWSVVSVSLVVALFASGCAGNREKQATSVKPSPGKKTESTENSGSISPPSTTDSPDGDNASVSNEVTDIQINAELDNGDSTNPTTTVTPSGPWDGKSFRGLGKWKVTPG